MVSYIRVSVASSKSAKQIRLKCLRSLGDIGLRPPPVFCYSTEYNSKQCGSSSIAVMKIR
eukprot:20729-Heterococcus_DN1.PRE.2